MGPRRLEKLCRYIARPPVSTERLSKLPDGRLLYRLKRTWRDGTSHVVFEPLELVPAKPSADDEANSGTPATDACAHSGRAGESRLNELYAAIRSDPEHTRIGAPT